MKENRIYNFNAGPAALPLEVLEEIKDSFLNFGGSGMSITEISHRSTLFDDVINDAVARTRRLLKLDDKFHVLFIQGGASLQFSMIPLNLLGEGDAADYVNTGTWSAKAIKEAEIMGKTIDVVASSEDKKFSYIPKNISFNSGAVYAHITSNNTIKGTQWASYPETGGVPLVADMSSDIMSRPFDVDKFGLIYAGAQKNIGPAGVCMVIIRDDMLKRVPDMLPSNMPRSLIRSAPVPETSPAKPVVSYTPAEWQDAQSPSYIKRPVSKSPTAMTVTVTVAESITKPSEIV